MTTTPFAINGLGRIGRALVRIARERPDLELVAVNDRAPAATLASLVARDSVHGPYGGEVGHDPQALLLDGRRVEVFCEERPSEIPWQGTTAQVVVECTGAFTHRRAAAQHLRDDGPQRVIVSAIVDDADVTLCHGVNDGAMEPRHRVISNASCTSQCLALLIDVLDRGHGVRQAMMNEVHSYTGNQALLDGANGDLRRARAAAINIVPTHTAAPAAVARVLPHLAGRLRGMAVRVPTPNVALLELHATLERGASADELRDLFRRAATGRLAGLLGVSDEPLVSSDFVGDTRSAVIDLELIDVSDDLCRVVAWYDNEWGYTHRLADLVELLGSRPLKEC